MSDRLRTSLLITIPFVLLLNSDRVVITTTMYPDASGVRQVRAAADSSLRREVTKWTREMTRGYDSDGIEMTTNAVNVARSTQVNDLGASEDVEAGAYDIVQKPLSLVTEYHWRETITIDFLGNEKEEAAAPVTEFEYRLNMPGAIQTTSPAAQIDGRRATWKVTANQDTFTFSAMATSVRWDVIVVLVYIVGYLVYRLVAFLVRRARLRPRKI